MLAPAVGLHSAEDPLDRLGHSRLQHFEVGEHQVTKPVVETCQVAGFTFPRLAPASCSMGDWLDADTMPTMV